MKPYHSINNVPDEYLGRDCIAFYKMDGSNLRFMWTKKQGWCRYGTRHRLFDETDPDYGSAIPLFKNFFADPIRNAVLERHPKTDEFIVYMEFFGPHSFAGQHSAEWLKVENNDPKMLVPFDINIHKKGLLSPQEFQRTLAGKVVTPQVVYEGPFTQEFIDKVSLGGYPDLVEGVVAKGCEGTAPHGIWMCKVKTKKYLAKLMERFHNNWRQYW